MSGRRRAWVYCSIDAPEDENDMLKKQREQLWEYAGQMGFEVAGSSSDTGRTPLWERSGFRRFVDAATRGEVDALLVADRRCLTHSMQGICGYETGRKAGRKTGTSCKDSLYKTQEKQIRRDHC